MAQINPDVVAIVFIALLSVGFVVILIQVVASVLAMLFDVLMGIDR
jgi:hypothetical protein